MSEDAAGTERTPLLEAREFLELAEEFVQLVEGLCLVRDDSEPEELKDNEKLALAQGVYDLEATGLEIEKVNEIKARIVFDRTNNQTQYRLVVGWEIGLFFELVFISDPNDPLGLDDKLLIFGEDIKPWYDDSLKSAPHFKRIIDSVKRAQQEGCLIPDEDQVIDQYG